MSERLYISDQAVEDLEDIWTYIAEDSVSRADGFVDRIYAKCVDLSELEGVGRARDELLPGLKSFPFKRYVIYFYRSSSRVDIVRVLHSARDVDEMFELTG